MTEATELWDRYWGEPSIENRNHLVVHYHSLVRSLASRVAAALPSNVDRDDLISYGLFGLMEVIESFDADRGVKFETFATPRIWGSIMDELRKIDSVPRSIRSKMRDIERVRGELRAVLNREPAMPEIAAQMGATLADLHQAQAQANAALVGTLEGGWEGDENDWAGDTTFDIGANPEDLFATTEITELVADAIAGLPERHKVILTLYYVQEMTLAEIGQALGVTESRVCQLQSKVLSTLRETLTQGITAAA